MNRELLEEIKEYYDVFYEDEEIIQVEDEVICDRCNGLGCIFCNDKGSLEVIITYDKKTCEEIDMSIKE